LAFAGIFQPAAALICVLILYVCMLWKFGVMAAADKKLLIATTSLTGNPAILILE